MPHADNGISTAPDSPGTRGCHGRQAGTLRQAVLFLVDIAYPQSSRSRARERWQGLVRRVVRAAIRFGFARVRSGTSAALNLRQHS